MAPIMLNRSPTLFQMLKRKSPKANAPTMVMITFFRFPAVLVMMGSFTRVQTKVEWLTVKPSIQLSPMDTCIMCFMGPQTCMYWILHCMHAGVVLAWRHGRKDA